MATILASIVVRHVGSYAARFTIARMLHVRVRWKHNRLSHGQVTLFQIQSRVQSVAPCSALLMAGGGHRTTYAHGLPRGDFESG
jgi:hypothetical protein